MNSEVKAKWLEALRSGEYVQGTGLLRSQDDKFCCLGVLCDLAVKDEVIAEPERPTHGGYRYGDDSRWDAGLPNEVRKWSGVADLMGLTPSGRELAHLNDTGSTFAQIADIIEEEF